MAASYENPHLLLPTEFDIEAMVSEEIRKHKALQAGGVGVQKNDSCTSSSSSQVTTPKLPTVFLSYSWAHKPTIIRIADGLKGEGFQVWIDIDQMKGSILEAMADGVEKAEIFVMAVSEKYKQSENCKKEATYASTQNKPIIPIMMEKGYKDPKGWLGLLMGAQLFFDFSTDSKFQTSFDGLVKELKLRGKTL